MSTQKENNSLKNTLLSIAGIMIMVLLSITGYLLQSERTALRKAIEVNTETTTALLSAVGKLEVLLNKETEIGSNERASLKEGVTENSKRIGEAEGKISEIQGDIKVLKAKL